MRTGVLGTGMVGNAIASGLVRLGHDVKMGSRDANNPKAAAWAASAGAQASHGTFAGAARFGEIVFNCTSGSASLDALRQSGEKNLSGKVLVDVANPLDFSRGMPPSLSICNTTSLAETIQAAFPAARVVKALNTMTAGLMTDPAAVAGEHDLFLCGNDAGAKARVVAIVRGWGWKQPIDLGDLTAARGMEMILPIWVRLMQTFGSPMFNFRIVRAG